MAEHNAEIYKKAFEIAVRCARELNGTPELKESYEEAQKDNRALKSFMDFCLKKAVEEIPEHTAADVETVVRCKKCLYRSQYSDENGMYKCGGILTEDGDCFLMVKPDHFCAYGERRGGD